MDGVRFGSIDLDDGEVLKATPREWSWFFYVRRGTMLIRRGDDPPVTVRAGEVFGGDSRAGFEIREATGRRGFVRTFAELGPYDPAADQPLLILTAYAPLSANVLLSSFSQHIHVTPEDPGPTAARLRALVDFVEDELAGDDVLVDREGVLQRLAELILVTLVRHQVVTADDIRAGLPTALADQRLWRALGAFQRAPAAHWTVERLAAAAGMSRTAFAIRFRDLIGEPPLHTLTRLRMGMATEMLTQPDVPLKRIAERIGYTTEAAFCRAFANHFGISPGRWRQSRIIN